MRYYYRCNQCENFFETTESPSEDPRCPECGSKDVEEADERENN